MLNKQILIIGSTGMLGTKLLRFCYSKNIKISCIVCKNNLKKLKNQKKKYHIKKSFCLNNSDAKNNFFSYLKKTKFKIVYFLDHGSSSLIFLSVLLKFQSKTIFAIANKEMIIAGSGVMINLINKSNNIFFPLDSEHFSLLNNNFSNDNVSKIYITASGGPFYFNKKIDINSVSKKQVLSHPKWKMGINNLIDSSNFINKILEIYELSSIFKISLEKIDFVISKEAFVHSIILFNDSTFTLNCFNNDMLITLIKPLKDIFKIPNTKFKVKKLFDSKSFNIEYYNDNRFKIFKYIDKLKKLKHSDQIKLMILNNKAQNLYLSDKIEYNNIIKYIIKNLDLNSNNNVRLNTINQIINYINYLNNKYS